MLFEYEERQLLLIHHYPALSAAIRNIFAGILSVPVLLGPFQTSNFACTECNSNNR